jgi:peptidoglycan/LPS O-acetylase OafA/YrhL
VDALRGAAALLVLLHHINPGSLQYGGWWLDPLRIVHTFGFVGVSLFLVLSGFSIHLRVAGGAPFQTGRFLYRRFLRLHPTYLAALAFAVTTYAASGGWPQPSWGLAPGRIPTAVLVVIHLTVLATTVVPAGWLVVAWSLALEEHIYLAYAATVGWLRRTRPVWWLLAGLGACVAWRLGSELLLPSVPKSLTSFTPQNTWVANLMYQQLPARVVEWLLGAVAAEWYAGNLRLPRPLTSRVGAALGLAGIWYLCRHRSGPVSLAGHPFALTDLVFDPAVGAGFFLLLCGCLARERRRGRPARVRTGLVWLGERSYSLYLVHLPVLMLAGRWAPDGLAQPVRAVLSGAAAVMLAAALYRWVEAPSIAWSKRAGRAPAPAHGSAAGASAPSDTVRVVSPVG